MPTLMTGGDCATSFNLTSGNLVGQLEYMAEEKSAIDAANYCRQSKSVLAPLHDQATINALQKHMDVCAKDEFENEVRVGLVKKGEHLVFTDGVIYDQQKHGKLFYRQEDSLTKELIRGKCPGVNLSFTRSKLLPGTCSNLPFFCYKEPTTSPGKGESYGGLSTAALGGIVGGSIAFLLLVILAVALYKKRKSEASNTGVERTY